MALFTFEDRNWIEYRSLPGLIEQDFHWTGEQPAGDYWDNMRAVRDTALHVLRKAQAEGRQYVLFTHGRSTSHPGATTARSEVRKLMRSKEATPFIVRAKCIQHRSVFLAAIRPLANASSAPPKP